MSDCGKPSTRKGDILLESIFVKGEIYNSLIDGCEIRNAYLTQGLTMDEQVAQDIANAISEYLGTIIKIPPEQIAKVFLSCTDGLPLTPGTKLATCQDLANLENTIQIPPEQIAKVFLSCANGLPLTPGTKLATCQDLANLEALIGGSVVGFAWTTTAKDTLRLTVKPPTGSNITYDADFTSFLQAFPISDQAPAAPLELEEPVAVYGLNTARLATPNRWRVVPGSNPVELIPVYFQS